MKPIFEVDLNDNLNENEKRKRKTSEKTNGEIPEKEIAKPLVIKGLAIALELNSYPLPFFSRTNSCTTSTLFGNLES